MAKDARIAPGQGVTECKKKFAKVTVTVKSSKDQSVIEKAKVTVHKSSAKKADTLTLPTSAEGKAIFVIRVGNYAAEATADGTTNGQAPDVPFKEGKKDAFEVKSKVDQAWDLVLDPVPRCKLFLRLQFKDPDGTDRPLPLQNGHLVFGSEEIPVKFDEDGNLLGEDLQPGRWIYTEKGKFKLTFKKPEHRTYLLFEKRGATAAKPIVFTGDSNKKVGKNRFFQLPHTAWGLKQAKWTLAEDGGTYTADSEEWDLTGKETLGAVDAPVTATLDPRWQFVRFVYYDRTIGGTDQISSLPVRVDGYAIKPAHSPSTSDRTTRACWPIGDDEKQVVQCIPWILYDSSAEKPDKDSQLRFSTKEHTYIETKADDKSRKITIGEQNTANADRLRFYDLPKEWRSLNWFVRTKTKGSDITDGKFFWELDTTAKVLGEKTKPLIFSLDDIVLYTKDKKPLPALGKKETGVCVFHHTFKTGTDLSDEGMFLPEADVAPRDSQPIPDTKFPVSKVEVLGRKPDLAKHDALLENYIVKYPDWTRVVTASGNVFDCFAERSVAKSGEDRVVGARAAVAWFDAVAQINGDDPVPGKGISPRPAAVRKPFCTIQPYVEMEAPITNRRRDYKTAKSKGSGTTSTTIHESLKAGRVGRSAERAKEWSTNQTAQGGIGRWDVALLRCCGVDENDATKEIAVLFQYLRLSVEFMTSCTYDDGGKKAWMKRNVTNLAKRWNGPDGAYNPGRPTIEHQGDAKPFSVEVLRFYQMNPLAQSDFKFQIVAADSGRDWMNSYQGLTQASEGNEKAEAGGRFTAAHEMGHGGGLLDDYCELWNHASFNQPGLPYLVPGDPYMMDDVDGAESMMKANKEMRARYFWILAEWLRPFTGDKDLQVVHGTGKPYSLPHHPRNAVGAKKWRSFLAFPYDSELDVSVTRNSTALKARADTYLWLLGEDVYSKTILPGKCLPSCTAVDAILVVAVHIGVEYIGEKDHDWLRSTSAKLISTLTKTFSYRTVAEFKCGTREIKRCLIHIAPRILVASYSGNVDYAKQIGAKPATYATGNGWSEGQLVIPSSGTDTVWYEVVYKTHAGLAGGQVWASNAEPAWPGAGNHVDQGNIRWVGMSKADGITKKYDQVIKEKAELNQLHVVLQVGAASEGLVSNAGELPLIKIKTGALTDIVKKVVAVGELVRTVDADYETRRNEIAVEYQTATNEKQNLEQQKTQKGVDKTALGPETDVNRAQHQTLANEIQALTQQITAKTQALTLIEGRWNTLGTARDNFRMALCIVDLYDAVKDMVNDLWGTQPSTTLADDAKFKGLVAARAATSNAAGQPDATRTSVINVVRNLKLKAALLKLPDPPEKALKPATVASVASAIIAVAEKVKDFGDVGSDAKAKHALAKQGQQAVAGVHTESEKVHTSTLTRWTGQGHSVQVCDRDENMLKPTISPSSRYEGASDTATFEEQLQKYFGEYMGIKTGKGSLDGYIDYVKPLADEPDKVKVFFAGTPPAPPAPPPTTTVSDPEPSQNNSPSQTGTPVVTN